MFKGMSITMQLALPKIITDQFLDLSNILLAYGILHEIPLILTSSYVFGNCIRGMSGQCYTMLGYDILQKDIYEAKEKEIYEKDIGTEAHI